MFPQEYSQSVNKPKKSSGCRIVRKLTSEMNVTLALIQFKTDLIRIENQLFSALEKGDTESVLELGKLYTYMRMES